MADGDVVGGADGAGSTDGIGVAGGSACAYELSKKNKSVLLVEYGSFHFPKDFLQREEKMFPQLFYDKIDKQYIMVLYYH